MKIIILSDYFEENVEKHLKKYCKSNYNKSGIFYQQNIFLGFEKIVGSNNVKMFCCPTCGTFPNESRLFWSPRFISSNKSIEYVEFCNILYLRNIFRYLSLKKHLKNYISSLDDDEPIVVLVIQMHYPFMKAYRYIKKHHSNSTACINIWDFPNYVDFRSKNFIKNRIRDININKTRVMLKDYALFFYLSRGMEELNDNKNRYIVHEGIISEKQIEEYNNIKANLEKDMFFHIVFTGRLTRQEGVLDLIEAVKSLNDDKIILEIAGGGDLESDIRAAAGENKNIIFHGLLNRDKVIELQCRADLFVLPRLPETYTNYSFPSKICEYIIANKPVLTRPLKCFDSNLLASFILFNDSDNDNLATHIREAIDGIKNGSISVDYSKFITKNLGENVAQEIIDFLGDTYGK